MDVETSVEEIEKGLEELREDNTSIPIIVEGKKDVAALRFLGCQGSIITINKGVSLTSFCDEIASMYDSVILLTDWDRKGGSLCKRIMRLLKGRVTFNTTYRDLFAKYAMTRKVEGLPSWLDTMKHRLESDHASSDATHQR